MDQEIGNKEYRFKELIKLSSQIINYPPFSDYTYTSGPVKSDICGDVMSIYLKTTDGIIEKVGMEGQACTVSRAVMVKTADLLIGKSISEVTREALLGAAIELGFNPHSTRASCAQFPSVVALMAVNK